MNDVHVGAVYRRVIEIYGSQFLLLIGLALVVSLVSSLVTLLLISGGSADTGALLVASLLSLVLGAVYTGVVVLLVEDVEDGRRDTAVGDLVRKTGPVLVPMLGVSILYGLAVAVGFVLLIVPGLIALTFLAVAVPVAVLERPGVFASLRRSVELVRGRALSVFLAILGVFVITALIQVIVGQAGGDSAGFILSLVLSTLLSPVTALVSAVLYFALRPQGYGAPQAPQGLGQV